MTTAADQSAEERRRTLEAERAVNHEYLRAMRELVEQSPDMARLVSTTRNRAWTGSGSYRTVGREVVRPVVGRVALDRDDPDLGRSFYIGPWRRELGQVQVVSWAASVASAFYQERPSSETLDAGVVARRSFSTTDDDLTDFEDNLEPGCPGDPFPPVLREARIPAPPQPVQRPGLTGARPKTTGATDGERSGDQRGRATVGAEPVAPASSDVRSPGLPAPTAEPAVSTSGRGDDLSGRRSPSTGTALRAERLVRSAIEAPRTGRLPSLLATLQPDQYELVSWPKTEPLLIQGGPGTGKTAVALHRAAYLTHRDAEERLTRVAVIGPTEQYTQHVRELLEAIGDRDSVKLFALPELLRTIAGLPPRASVKGAEKELDTSWKLGLLVERARAAMARTMGPPARERWLSPARVLEALLTDHPAVAPLLDDTPEFRRWLLKEVKSYDNARQQERFLPFLAALHLAAGPPTDLTFQHLIVDEAQDLRPLEWRCLQKLLRRDGNWTILGDEHQQRAGWTSPSWNEIARLYLELTDDEGSFRLTELDTAYRSTSEILRFAGQLLPRGERQLRALRPGTPPEVRRVGSSELVTAVGRALEGLAARFAPGLVAAISMDPDKFNTWLNRKGWRRTHERHTWKKNGWRAQILHAEQARGLEFDAVVVAEPAEFPENVGKQGLLYTSLTRATKELVVIHTRALPRKLRRRA